MVVNSIASVFTEAHTLTVCKHTYRKFQPPNEVGSLGNQPIAISRAILLL